MPGIYRHTIDQLAKIVTEAIKNKIPMVALFPSTSLNKKDDLGSEALRLIDCIKLIVNVKL